MCAENETQQEKSGGIQECNAYHICWGRKRREILFCARVYHYTGVNRELVDSSCNLNYKINYRIILSANEHNSVTV